MKQRVLFSTIILAVTLLGAPLASLAQEIPDGVSIPGVFPDLKEQISTTVTPQTPKPFQEVTISAEAYGTDLNRATISWSLNGKEVLKGTGEKKFVFKVGAVGSTNRVNLKITPVSGPLITRSFDFTPAEVDVIWEAKTYTPPFYKGKALFSPEADVTFVAQPNIVQGGKNIAASDAIYKWKVDRRVQGDKSGFGKNTFNYTGSVILKPHLIQAEAYAKEDEQNKGLGGAEINPIDPQAVMYESHPLYGILFNKAVGSRYYLDKAESQLAVFPYYFSTLNKNSFVTYKWRLNDTQISAPSFESVMSFRKDAKQDGSASVSVVITNATKILQQASARLSLIYSK